MNKMRKETFFALSIQTLVDSKISFLNGIFHIVKIFETAKGDNRQRYGRRIYRARYSDRSDDGAAAAEKVQFSIK